MIFGDIANQRTMKPTMHVRLILKTRATHGPRDFLLHPWFGGFELSWPTGAPWLILGDFDGFIIWHCNATMVS